MYKKLNLKYKSILLLLTILLFNSSCEELIEVDLPSDQIHSSKIFEDINLAKSALSGIYTNFRNSSFFNGYSSGAGTILSLYTDELTALADLNSPLDEPKFYNNEILSSNISIANLWDTSYKHIYSINSFIEGLTNSTKLDSDQKKILLSEAIFIRSIYYQYLTSLFGDIPYITTTNYKTNTSIGKTTHLEVLDRIETDLKYSLDNLPDSYRNVNRFYPNKACVQLVLAKNYILKKQDNLAEQQLIKILNSSQYSIESNLNRTFKKDAKSTLWQLDSNSPDARTLEAANYIFQMLPPPLYTLNPSLLNNFSTDDLRRQNWIKDVSKDDQTWSHSYKYKNNTTNPDEYSIVFRLEEVYQLYIETCINTNKLDIAIEYINHLKQRANITPLPLSLNKQQTLKEYLNESQREFFTEHGNRFFTLKRNGQLSILKDIKKNWQDKNSLFPIPEKELLINTKLLPQNNGY